MIVHCFIKLVLTCSEEDEDDPLTQSTPPSTAIRQRTDPLRSSVPVLPTEVPPRPPRHTLLPSSGSSSGGRGPLPPLPQQQQPVVQPRPPPVAARSNRPLSTSAAVLYGREFGPGKQEKEVRCCVYNCLLCCSICIICFLF